MRLASEGGIMTISISGLVGTIIGALFGSFLIYSLIHWAIFKRFIEDRLVSHVLAAVFTYPLSAILQNLGAGNSSAFSSEGFITYLLPWPIVIAFSIMTGKKQRRLASDVNTFQ